MTEDGQVRIKRGVVIHGGVGTLPEDRMTSGMRQAYVEALRASLDAGHRALEDGGDAVDAVVAAVTVMEDSPLFNAGRGSNFDERGVVTMDASLQRGWDRSAGSVAGVTGFRNPIRLARRIMEESEHVMLIGEGAEAFAARHGLESADAEFFHTERRWKALERAREAGKGERPNVLGDGTGDRDSSTGLPSRPSDRAGTVGAVALDGEGRIAAATSTGGMANKTWGRVGDSPIIAAGTYAGRCCAVSCTGWGEYFIRNAAAYDVHARMAHGGATLQEAVHAVVWETLDAEVPGSGGMVAVDPAGHVELSFNTPGMYRGWVDTDGLPSVAIYRDG